MKKRIFSVFLIALSIVTATGNTAVAAGTQHLYSSKGILSIKIGDDEVAFINTNELSAMFIASKDVDTKMKNLKTDADNASKLLVQTINLKNSATSLKATAASEESLNDLVLKVSFLGLENAIFKYDSTYYRIENYTTTVADGFLYGNENVFNSDEKRKVGYSVTVKANATALSDTDIKTYANPNISKYNSDYTPIAITSYGLLQNDLTGDARTATTLKTDKKYMESYFDMADFKTLNNNLTAVEKEYRECNALYNQHKSDLITILFNRNIDVSGYNEKNIDDVPFTDVISKVSKISVANGNTTNLLHVGGGGYTVTQNKDGTFNLMYKMR